MHDLETLFQQNKAWAAAITSRDPDFFQKLSRQQSPEYLWIGCSDSRVPANEIVGLLPGEMFVHRNIANVVSHSDLNCLSVIEFAIDRLKVKHIMVVGHYGCSGVRAALRCDRIGLVDNWLRHVQDVCSRHEHHINCLETENARADRLCELNVIQQVYHVCQTSIVRDAWERGQSLAVHGLIYGLKDGLLRDLEVSSRSVEESHERYRGAVSVLADPKTESLAPKR